MIVMLGECTGKPADRIQSLGWGRLWIARTRNIYTYPNEPWGFDNGAFQDWLAGRLFDELAYRRALDRAVKAGTPYMAVVPDIVEGGPLSLEFSLKWRDELPAEWSRYLAVQDGMTIEDVESVIGLFDGIFLGGSNRFKGTAPTWRKVANEHGKRFHYGRAGTLRKLDHAEEVGADSVDSAFPMWTHDRFWAFAERWKNGNPQLRLV